MALPSALKDSMSKCRVKKLLRACLERFKLEQKDKADRDLERVRADLKKETFEHEARFRKLHDQASDVLAEVFLRLSKLVTCVENYVSPYETADNPLEKRLEAVRQALKELQDYFYDQRLFLSKELFAKIRELIEGLWRTSVTFRSERDREAKGLINRGDKDHLDIWEKARLGMIEAQGQFGWIHNHIQRLLGLTSEEEVM